MKSLLLRLSLGLLAPALFAAAPHPSVLTVKYKGEFLPVVRVKGSDPYVLVEGKETRIRSEPVYLLQDGTGYSGNFVTVPPGSLGGRMSHQLLGANTYDVSQLHTGEIDIDLALTARDAIQGGFIAAVMISSSGPGEIIVQELPALPAGQRVKVKLSVHALPRELDPMYFAQIFDASGREVLTNDLGYAWSYYAARDRARLAVAVKKYVEKYHDADHEAVAAITPKPVFKPGWVLPEGEITVQLSVGEDGTVLSVDAGMIADDRARESITNALSGWLFLPKLKAGQPVPTFINVPLQF